MLFSTTLQSFCMLRQRSRAATCWAGPWGDLLRPCGWYMGLGIAPWYFCRCRLSSMLRPWGEQSQCTQLVHPAPSQLGMVTCSTGCLWSEMHVRAKLWRFLLHWFYTITVDRDNKSKQVFDIKEKMKRLRRQKSRVASHNNNQEWPVLYKHSAA